jgi:hypothetical protein
MWILNFIFFIIIHAIVIATIGTFSWWSGWLAGGEVTYFKSPAKQGTAFAHRLNYKDYFDPEWIGL